MTRPITLETRALCFGVGSEGTVLVDGRGGGFGVGRGMLESFLRVGEAVSLEAFVGAAVVVLDAGLEFE
jgi:hypothetical protein